MLSTAPDTMPVIAKNDLPCDLSRLLNTNERHENGAPMNIILEYSLA